MAAFREASLAAQAAAAQAAAAQAATAHAAAPGLLPMPAGAMVPIVPRVCDPEAEAEHRRQQKILAKSRKKRKRAVEFQREKLQRRIVEREARRAEVAQLRQQRLSSRQRLQIIEKHHNRMHNERQHKTGKRRQSLSPSQVMKQMRKASDNKARKAYTLNMDDVINMDDKNSKQHRHMSTLTSTRTPQLNWPVNKNQRYSYQATKPAEQDTHIQLPVPKFALQQWQPPRDADPIEQEIDKVIVEHVETFRSTARTRELRRRGYEVILGEARSLWGYHTEVAVLILNKRNRTEAKFT